MSSSHAPSGGGLGVCCLPGVVTILGGGGGVDNSPKVGVDMVSSILVSGMVLVVAAGGAVGGWVGVCGGNGGNNGTGGGGESSSPQSWLRSGYFLLLFLVGESNGDGSPVPDLFAGGVLATPLSSLLLLVALLLS